MRQAAITAIAVLITINGAIAQSDGPLTFGDDTSNPFVITGYLDNDGGILKRNNPEDRHYTNGFGFTFAHQPDFAGQLTAMIPFGDDFDPRHAWAGYTIGQQMFTPHNLSARRLVRDDRPYAGYLFGSFFLQRVNDVTVDHFQFDLGVVGPASQADHLQRAVHELFDAEEPRGWDNQLHDEVTVQFHLRKKWRLPLLSLAAQPQDMPLEVQLLPQVGASVGTVHRYLEAGATLRAGINLPNDFGIGRLEDVAAYGPGRMATTRGLGGYVYIRAAGRAVEHNLFLDGNTFRDSHSVDARPLIGEWQVGVAAQYHHDNLSFEVGYAQTFQSEAFYGQHGGDSHATLTLRFTCAF